MSILGEQIKELREAARQFEGYQNGEISRMMREAAYTIESLRDRLQPVPAELDYIEDKSRWFELFGTPERAARTLVDSCNDDYDYGCGGCPVARVNCKCGDYDALLEWLRSDAE